MFTLCYLILQVIEKMSKKYTSEIANNSLEPNSMFPARNGETPYESIRYAVYVRELREHCTVRNGLAVVKKSDKSNMYMCCHIDSKRIVKEHQCTFNLSAAMRECGGAQIIKCVMNHSCQSAAALSGPVDGDQQRERTSRKKNVPLNVLRTGSGTFLNNFVPLEASKRYSHQSKVLEDSVNADRALHISSAQARNQETFQAYSEELCLLPSYLSTCQEMDPAGYYSLDTRPLSYAVAHVPMGSVPMFHRCGHTDLPFCACNLLYICDNILICLLKVDGCSICRNSILPSFAEALLCRWMPSDRSFGWGRTGSEREGCE